MAEMDVTAKFRADISDMKSKMDRINSSLTGMKKSTAKAQGGFTILKGAIGTAFGGAIVGGVYAAGKALGNLAGDAIDAASSMEELQSKVNAIFGAEAGAEIAAWSEGASKAFGQSQIQAQNAASTFAIFGKGAGLAGGDLVDFSTGLTELSSDLASFYDASPEEAIQAIGSALRGETEPIRKFGVMLDASTMKQKALELGIIKSTKDALLPNQKALAAQALIMEQTADAQGDFARTSDGLANSQRTLTAVIEDIKTEVGKGLLPAITEIVQAVGPMLEQLAGPLGEVAEQIGGVLADAFESLAPLLPVVAETFGQIATTIGGALTNVLKTLVPALAPILQAFSQLASRLAPLVTKVLTKVAEILGRVLEAVTPLLGPLTDLVMGILDAAWPIVEVVADALLLLVDALTPVLDAVMALIKPLGDLIQVGLKAIMPVIKPLLPVIEALAAVFADVLVRAIGLVMTSIGFMIQAWSKLAPFVINKVLRPLLDRFLGWAEGIVAGAETAFSWVPGLGDKLGTAKDAIEGFRKDSSKALEKVAETAATEGEKIGKNLVEQGTAAMTDPSSLSNAQRAGQGVGDSLAEGMRIGIQNGQIPVAREAAKSVAIANQAARDAAMARSPSKLFAKLGKDLSDGLAQGIKDGGDNVRQAMQQNFVQWFRDTRRELKSELDAARQEFADYSRSVSESIRGSIDFSAAAPQFDEAGNRVGSTFIEALRGQAEKAKEFATRVKTLVAMNLSQDALQQVLAAGVDAGTAIANELIGGGQKTIDETNALVDSTKTAADEVGKLAAQNFYGAGVDSAQQTYLGFKANFGKGGPARQALMNVMDKLAAKAARDVRIDVAVTRNINEVVTRVVQEISAPNAEPRAKGGPVRANSLYLVGEKGPEYFLPDRNGTIFPNLNSGSIPIAGSGGGGGNVTNIRLTVNAGMGTNGAEVGREIVDALRQYERRNGPLPVKVSA